MSETLPTAQEAAQAVEAGHYEKAQKQLSGLTRSILEAISKGARSYGFSGNLEPSVKAEFEVKGYKLQSSTDPRDHETWTTITW